MKVLAINAAYRKKGTTTQLTERALEAAASRGAETEAVMLRDLDLRICTNCLKCYRDFDSPIGPCSLDDDMTPLLDKLSEADGVLLCSPIHNGFLTALMVLFFERLVWRMCNASGVVAGYPICPGPRTDKVRALATIVSAGGIPTKLRKFCDGTPFLKENGTNFLNAQWVGDLYAGAVLEKRPETEQDWRNLYFLRKLSEPQLRQAHDLGIKMVETLEAGGLRPEPLMSPITEAAVKVYTRFVKPYDILDEDGG